MHCPRCAGLMFLTRFYDLQDDTGTIAFDAWRCIACGEVLDSMIEKNRSRPAMVARHWKPRPPRASA